MRGLRVPEPVRLGLLLLAAVALQAMLTSRVAVLGVGADLFLILTVLVALTRGALSGVVFGFCAGLVADVIFMDPVGMRAFIYLLVGYGVGRYSEELSLKPGWGLIALAASAALLAEVVYGTFQFVMGPHASFFTMMKVQVLPATLVNGLLAAPVYLALVRIGALRQPGSKDPSFR
jgi:rod shape-determining protein MreD